VSIAILSLYVKMCNFYYLMNYEMVDVYSMYFTTNSNKTFQLLLVNSTAANNNTQYIYCTTASVAIIYNHSIIIVWSILITFIQVYIVLHKECAIVPTA